MARGWSKFRLLLWKNWTLQKRHVVQTLVEILVPIILSILVVFIRSLVHPKLYPDPFTYPAFDVDEIPGPVHNKTWAIAWCPKTERLETVMKEVSKHLGMFELGFSSASELNSNLTSQYQKAIMRYTLAGVYFGDETALLNDPQELPKSLSVTLRFPGESRITSSMTFNPSPTHLLSWWTNFLFPLFQVPGPRHKNSTYGGFSPGYAVEGFLSLQQAITTKVISSLSGSVEDADVPTVTLKRFPYPPFVDDPILQALQAFVALIVMLSFVYTCISTVKVITTEKEKQLKEAMKIMGLPNWLHWTAWFLKCLVFQLVSIIFIVVLLKVRWFPTDGGFSTSVFQTSDASVVFIFLTLYIINTITFCFAVSVFFSKANTASTVAGLLWFLTYIPYTFMQPKYSEIDLGSKLASCLLGNTAMAYGFQLILMHEGTGLGAQWNNLWSPTTPDDDLFLGHVMLMLLADSFIYLLITIYVEAVFPGDYGVPQPWNFFLKRSYWLGEKYDNSIKDMMTPTLEDSCEVHEPEPTHLMAGIQIKHLKKVYNKKPAVNDLNLNMYEGHITVLLGHNGAGKTTTMSMLTGMITPTSGTAVVSGYDVRTQISRVRESLGLCPQHNVLFEELTVREHLYFFGKLKGLDGDELEREIIKYITMIGLMPKENQQSSTLSGGMQRKLAACVALCGNSKVVMFDEPTSGMDPTARRALWDLLQAEKKGRTILLTTHFMDEADLLGDRIAIMAGGELQCVGSSFYLKKKYGEGYRLVLVKGPDCNVTGTTELLRKYIPEVQVSQNIGTELSYLLRDDLSPVFEQMFEDLEGNKQRLDIISYGVSLTTMEEVFMKAGKDKEGVKENGGAHINGNDVVYNEEPLQKFHSSENVHSSTSELDVEGSSEYLLSGFKLTKNQLYAMFMKKVIYSSRSWLMTTIQVLLPVVFLIITFFVTQTWQGTKDLPARDITLDEYNEYYTPVVSLTKDNAVMDLYNQYIQDYKSGLIERPLGENLTQYLLNQSEENIGLVSQRYLVAASFDKTEDGNSTNITAWFNNQALHTAPLTMNLAYNSVLKKKMGDSYKIQIINYPLPFLDSNKLMALLQGDNIGFQVAFNLSFSFAFATAFYILFTVKERVTKAKLLQFVSGVEVLTFWGSAIVWDLVTFLLPILGIVFVMLAFQETGFKSGEDIGTHVLVMLLFIWAAMPFMYLCSFFFTIPSTGYTRVSMITIILGCAMFMIVTIIEYPDLELENVAKIMDWVCLISPHYNLAMAFRTRYNAKSYYDICSRALPICMKFNSPCCKVESQCAPAKCLEWTDDFFSFKKPGIGRHITYFAVEGFVFIAILLLVEFKLLEGIYESCRTPKQQGSVDNENKTEEVEDFDVANEKYKIRHIHLNPQERHTLLLQDMTKFYGNFRAVNDICLGVSKGECFGLLGVNGAGKTTTFKMLTGDEKISFGDAFVEQYSLRTNMKQVHQLIGYCPQFDALIDDLTGREALVMFCMLRGIPRHNISQIVNQLANDLLFMQHIDKKIKEYSGGNKRKLSTAVALVGNPPVVYLDEPTTGMDPVAKRHLWNVICKVRDSGKVIILTSHSMEECEALCTRSAIMVNGEFKCLGSTQHLKSRFAQGYTLTVKVKRLPGKEGNLGSQELEPIKKLVETSFPGSELREEFQGLLTYYIKNPTLTWARMFGVMENAKKELNIEDYSVGQTSLEQVFLTFTKSQREEIG